MEKYTYHLRGGCASLIAEMTCIDQCNTFDWDDIQPICAGVFHTVDLKADGAHTVGLKANGTVVGGLE